LASVPSGCGLEVGTISLPSGTTTRLRPPRRWKRIGAQDERTAIQVAATLFISRAAHAVLRQCTWSCGMAASCAASGGGGSGSPAA
jgi:hypothetical protein